MGNKKKIAFSILIVVLIAVYVGAKTYANNVAEKKVNKAIDNEISREKDQFTKEAMEAFKKFIKDPNKISISISPEKPVPIGRLQRVNDPKEIIKLLNVKISI